MGGRQAVFWAEASAYLETAVVVVVVVACQAKATGRAGRGCLLLSVPLLCLLGGEQ